MKFFGRRAPGPQRVEPTDVDAHALLAAAQRPASDLDGADEVWLWHGEDRSPIAVSWLRRDAERPGLIHAWLTVDPVLRQFGTGERVWAHVLTRAKKLKATTIASFAQSNQGYKFLIDHGFVATTTAEDPASTLEAKPRVDGELTLEGKR